MEFNPAEQIWDYIYVDDLANAFIALAANGKDQKCYTLGTGEGRLLRDYIYAIRDAIDTTLDIGIPEASDTDEYVMKLEADITDLVSDTGFVPEVSFEDGIRRTVEWAKEHMTIM